MKIDVFGGDYEFLRNDYECNVVFDGEMYSCVERAFQAAKTDDKEKREEIRNAATLRDARKIGRNFNLPIGWGENRLVVMKELLKSKFSDNLALKFKLLLTEDAELVQGGMINGDKFWGVDEFGDGENHLGKLLMEVRNEIAFDLDVQGVLAEAAPELLKQYLEDHKLGFLCEHLLWQSPNQTSAIKL
jgi:ribA/ribD-fused uncharacterized protein